MSICARTRTSGEPGSHPMAFRDDSEDEDEDVETRRSNGRMPLRRIEQTEIPLYRIKHWRPDWRTEGGEEKAGRHAGRILGELL